MRKMFILLNLTIGFFLLSTVNAQTKITFAKNRSSKTITVALAAGGEKSFSVAVRKNKVINVNLSGDIATSGSNKFPVVAVNLTNADDNLDNFQDGEGYLSILAVTNGTYIFSVSNSSQRTRTFQMKVTVSSNRDDYVGGISN